MVCDPYPATCGFSLCILRSSRIVNSTINRPEEKLIAFINVLLPGDFRLEERASESACLINGWVHE